MCLHPFNFYPICGHALPAGPIETCYDDDIDPHLSLKICPYYEAGLRQPAQGMCPDCKDSAKGTVVGEENTTGDGAKAGQDQNSAGVKESRQYEHDTNKADEEDEEWAWMER